MGAGKKDPMVGASNTKAGEENRVPAVPDRFPSLEELTGSSDRRLGRLAKRKLDDSRQKAAAVDPADYEEPEEELPLDMQDEQTRRKNAGDARGENPEIGE